MLTSRANGYYTSIALERKPGFMLGPHYKSQMPDEAQAKFATKPAGFLQA